MSGAGSLAASFVLGAAHPHLFFQGGDVPALRSAAQTTHREIASHLTQILAQHFDDPAPTTTDYDDPRFFGQDVCAWAFGYQLTGDARYAAQAQLRLKTYLTWSDWGFGEIASLGEPDLNIGHFLIGVSCAYDLLYTVLPDADRSAIGARLAAEADRMYLGWNDAWYVDQYPQNHNWINAAGMGLAGLALQGEDSRAGNWLARAQDDLGKVNLVLGAILDGSWHEGILYQEYGISMSLPFWMALRAGGSDYTDMGILRGLGRMFLAAQIPDAPRQQILLHGDFTGWPKGGMIAMLRFAAARFQDGFAETAAQRWLAAGPRSHLLPDMFFEVFEFLGYDPTIAAADPHALPLDTYLPDLQAAVLHSSWDPGDLALAFKAAPYGGRANFDRMKAGREPGGHLNWGHDHNDDMSFWLWGNGTWLAPEAAGYDAGSNTGYAVSKRANMTVFHNGLLIDGNGELGDTRGSDDERANSWFFNRDAQPLLTPTGTADYAVAGGRGASLYGSSLGLSRWDRVVVLARKRYALVHDDVVASSSHTYEWICHFLDGANVDAASGWVQGLGRNGMSLGVRVVSPPSWTATTGTQSENLTFLFEPDNSISYVRIRPSAASAAAQFLTALLPVQTSAWSSRMRIDPLSATDTGAGTVIAPGSDLEERWIFGTQGVDAKAAGDLALTASLAGMVGRNAGAPIRALLIGPGILMDQDGSRLLLASQSARSIEADLQGGKLAVTGDGIADFQAFAPGVTSVTINGERAVTSKSAGIVQYPAVPVLLAITSSPESLTNRMEASFTFTSSGDGTTFSCTLDSSAAAPCTSPVTYGGLADGSHTFAITARDAMGNVPAPASFTWMVDTTAPAVSLASGPSARTRDTTATFSFSSSEAGSIFSCKLDAREPAPCASPARYGALVDGSHLFTAAATDPAGNVSAPSSFAWTIDTTPPHATIVSGPPPLTNQTTAVFAFSSSKAGSAYFCKLDGGAEVDSCSNPFTLSGLADGGHTLAVRASDELGNLDPVPATYVWAVDTVRPVTTITSHPPAVTTQTTATLIFSTSKPGATFECELDAAGDFAACGSPLLLTGLAPGDHVIHVRARDAIGNIDSSAPSCSWTIVQEAGPVHAGGCSSGGAPATSMLAWIAALLVCRRRCSKDSPSSGSTRARRPSASGTAAAARRSCSCTGIPRRT